MALTLFCEKGAYDIPQDSLDRVELLRKEYSDLLFLVDNNDLNFVPFIKIAKGLLKPTLVYITLQLKGMKKDLKPNYRDKQKCFVMNPWTLFKLEWVAKRDEADRKRLMEYLSISPCTAPLYRSLFQSIS